MGEAAEGKGSDELGGVGGENDVDVSALLGELAGEVEGFVTGDAAGDTEGDVLVVKWGWHGSGILFSGVE